MLIINHGNKYNIPDEYISSNVYSLLKVILNTNVGVTIDIDGYIILDDIPSNAFKSYITYLSFGIDFEWNEEIAQWFNYLGHNNEYDYPLDYWKVKLIDDHDVEFKYLTNIDRIQYLLYVSGKKVDALEFINANAMNISSDMIDTYANNVFEDDIPHIYTNTDSEYQTLITRYITVYNLINGVIWFDFDKIHHDEYIRSLLYEIDECELNIMFPMLGMEEIIDNNSDIERKIQSMYSTMRYNESNNAMNIFIEETIGREDIIDIRDYDWEDYLGEELRATNHYMIEELLADYLDRTVGSTLEKLHKYNEEGKYKIKGQLLLDNFDNESLFELAKSMNDPDYNKNISIRDQMRNLYLWLNNEGESKAELDEIYVNTPVDTMSIILLVAKYGYNIERLLDKMEPVQDNITIKEFYNISPLVNKNKTKNGKKDKPVLISNYVPSVQNIRLIRR